MSDEKQKDLPWLINNSEPDNKSLKQAIEDDEALKQESEFLSSLRENMQSQKIPTPGEFGLARLKREVAEAEKQTGTPFSGFNRWARPALAAALVVVILQSALLIDQSNIDDEGYQPLAGDQPNANLIQIAFKPGTSELQLREAINLTGGKIIGGPGELGIYTVALDKSIDRDTVIKTLSALDYIDNVTED